MLRASGRAWCWLALLCCLLVGPGRAQGPVPLRAALVPYLVDVAGDHLVGLTRLLKGEFERTHPGIELHLDPIDHGQDPYDFSYLTQQLGSRLDVLELDTLFLQEMVDRKLVEPWPEQVNLEGMHPAGREAGLVSGRLYAVPHWLCGYFLVTRDPTVARAGSLEELLRALDRGPLPHLSADFTGPWNLPYLYLTAWAQSHPQALPGSAVKLQLDPQSAGGLARLAREVSRDHTNPGLDGSFHDREDAALEFAARRSRAYLGFSESLHAITEQGSGPFLVGPAPLGAGRGPLLFVDGFLLRRGLSPEVRQAAVEFVNFMNTPEALQLILLCRDAPHPTTPRYLLPANQQAMPSDPLYDQLRPAIQEGRAFPNGGLKRLGAGMEALLEHRLRHTP